MTADLKAGALHGINRRQHFAPLFARSGLQRQARRLMHQPMRLLQLLEAAFAAVQLNGFGLLVSEAVAAAGVAGQLPVGTGARLRH